MELMESTEYIRDTESKRSTKSSIKSRHNNESSEREYPESSAVS